MNVILSIAIQFAKSYYYWLIVIIVILAIILYDFNTKPTPIANLFLIPHYPVVGNLIQLRNNPAKTLLKWSLKYNQAIYQIRLGNKQVIVVNSYEYVNQLWNKYACSNNSRPMTYTFHNIISATQGFTIGSTPSNPSCKRAKKSLALNLNSKSIASSNILEIINLESKLMIRKLFLCNIELSGPPSVNIHGNKSCILGDINLMEYSQMYILRISLLISFGYDLINQTLATEIINVESMIMKFRSPLGNLADYLPILRKFHDKKPNLVRSRRDVYMKHLFDHVSNDSIIGKLILQNDLNHSEIRSIALSLISAGLDNTPMNFNHLMGHLSQKYGYKMQNEAFHQLVTTANNDICQAWMNSILINCDYILALIYETLRFFTVLPLSLPRITTKPIEFYDSQGNSTIIPTGTTLFMNAYAANHDSKKFDSPYTFSPDRWLTTNGKIVTHVNHFAFGAGSRKCSGTNLAIQQLYTLTCRTILMFKIFPPIGTDLMELDPFKNNSYPSAISFEPKPFKVRLKPRLYPRIDELYYKIVKE